MSPRSLLGISALLVASLATGIGAQEIARGSITGQVRDQASGAPVSAAQVYIASLSIGVLTQANGRYLLINVPVGTHQVRVERLGFEAASAEVTVSAGQSRELNFAVREDALALDEIVVTGTAGQARRREVGNTIAQLNAVQVPEPAANLGSLIQGRLAGVSVVEGSGSSGSGVEIKLRGNVSATMSNSPLIYIDGVRAKSEPYPGPDRFGGAGYAGGSDFMGPLNDINPSDIERIEIVKGPAATTLYGTEAAAGVIQIFTKRGASGNTEITAETRQGFSYLLPFATDEVPYGHIDPVMRNGHRQQYSLSVSGGRADQLSYFASGQWEDNEGVLIADGQEQFNLRGNVQFRPDEDWLAQLTSGLTTSLVDNAALGSTGTTLSSALAGDLAGLYSRDPRVMLNAIDRENSQGVTRYVNGLTVSFTPTADFTHRLTLGMDDSQFESSRSTPFGWRDPIEELVGRTFDDFGSIFRVSSHNRVRTFDYVGTLSFGLTGSVRSSASFGLQGVENTEETLWVQGNRFPGPGEYTVASTSQRDGFQVKSRVVTGGFFFQDMLALSDRYFLTLGVRVDGNSAFGSGFGLQPYPKLSFSYVLSDEGFWPESFGTMKLRGALGWAGRAPGAFDAVRTWNPTGFGTLPAFVPANLGNPDLGPERTREIEVGFDGSFLNDRLVLEYTYYRRNTTEVLFRAPAAPSMGNWATQFKNVGELYGSGNELSVRGTLVAGSSFGWELGAAVATTSSKVLSLGGSASYLVHRFAWVIEGEPLPVFRGHRIENYFEAADPDISRDVTLGPGYAPYTVDVNTQITLPGRITLSGRGQYQARSYMHNHMERLLLSRNFPLPQCWDAYRRVDPAWALGEPGKEKLRPARPAAWPSDMLAWERAKCFGYDERLAVTPVEYFQVRDVTLSVPISTLLPSLANWATRTDMTVSVRNPWYWKNKELALGHPEQQERWGSTGSVPFPLERMIGTTLPPASYFTVSARVVF